MKTRPILRYATAIAALCAIVLAVRVSYTTAERHGGLARVLPGAPLPDIYNAPAPVKMVSEAIASPFQAAAATLRPIAKAIFPSLWEAAPAPAAEDSAYAVRDNALRIVKESL